MSAAEWKLIPGALAGCAALATVGVLDLISVGLARIADRLDQQVR